MTQDSPYQERLKTARDTFHALKDELGKAMVGQRELVDDCLIAIFSQGHVLLEGVPGLGKTFFVKMLSHALDLSHGRIQCTPDLMPADILGTHIIHDEGNRRAMRFERGPVFHNLLLVDEINRATPKTQSALLEVMQERTVTTGGEHHALPSPFFVLATQNPMEMEGTYPLPEAQLDRFLFKLKVPFPTREELVEISRRTTSFDELKLESVVRGEDLLAIQKTVTELPVADPLVEYAASIILATHPDQPDSSDEVKRYVSYGSSPRGLQAIVRGARVHCLLEERTAVSAEDMRAVVRAALRHRVILNFEGEAESIDTDALIGKILEQIPTPANTH